MTLDFNETAIINQTLDVDSREEYLKKLDRIIANTQEDELKTSLQSLSEKISVINDTEFQRLKEDRNANKVFSFPTYFLS